jgi:hypothetical protein
VLRGGQGPMQDYGSQRIAQGQTALLTLDIASPTSPLTLPDGSKVTPTTIGAPLPPKPGFDYALIAGIAAGIVVLVLGSAIAARRRPSPVRLPGQRGFTPPATASFPPQSPPPAAAPHGLPVTYCGECGQAHSSNVSFCANCGHPFVSRPRTAFCPQCGDAVAPNERFCDKCGTRLV